MRFNPRQDALALLKPLAAVDVRPVIIDVARPLILASLACVLALLSVCPVWAEQRTLPQVDDAVTELQATVAAIQKEVAAAQKDIAIAGISRRLDAVAKDVADVKRLANERSAPEAPAAAWLALAFVGGLFAGAWGLVSKERERSRQREAALVALVKIHDKEPDKKSIETLKTQVEELKTLLNTTAAGSLTELLEQCSKLILER